MNSIKIDPELIKKTIDFHGHWCPGLAIGIRAAELALSEIGKGPDEEIVAVVETDMCAVDAIQYLTGCTFGKGNLIFKDYGKNAFTFYRRRDGKAIRIVTRPSAFGTVSSSTTSAEVGSQLGRLRKKLLAEGLTEEEQKIWEEAREAVSKRIMESTLEDLFEVKPSSDPLPKRARMLESLICEACKESVMETRTRRFQGQTLCIPCFEAVERR
ncbi:MAG: TraR/DksA C4-type zinc finger protein [Syntrophaceae bacterium]|nr:TraR/DksA C4-type zinc finger protein [Syntrophaceae bacterium]